MHNDLFFLVSNFSKIFDNKIKFEKINIKVVDI